MNKESTIVVNKNGQLELVDLKLNFGIKIKTPRPGAKSKDD